MNYTTIQQDNDLMFIGDERSAEIKQNTSPSFVHWILYDNQANVIDQGTTLVVAAHNLSCEWVDFGRLPGELPYPFMLLTPNEIHFNDAPNWRQAVKNTPREFYDHLNPWTRSAESLFFRGMSKTEENTVRYTAHSTDDRTTMWNYIRSVIGSWEIERTAKMALVGSSLSRIQAG